MVSGDCLCCLSFHGQQNAQCHVFDYHYFRPQLKNNNLISRVFKIAVIFPSNWWITRTVSLSSSPPACWSSFGQCFPHLLNVFSTWDRRWAIWRSFLEMNPGRPLSLLICLNGKDTHAQLMFRWEDVFGGEISGEFHMMTPHDLLSFCWVVIDRLMCVYVLVTRRSRFGKFV